MRRPFENQRYAGHDYNTTLNARLIEPDEIQPDDRFGYKIIAFVSPDGKRWAAYRGGTNWTDLQVQTNGDKISEKAASELFPTLANKLIYND